MNAFLELRDMEVRAFVEERQDRVRHRVESRLRTLEFWGDVLELFVPVMADTVTSLTGGEPIAPDVSYLTILEGERQDNDEDSDTPPPGPSDRDEIIR